MKSLYIARCSRLNGEFRDIKIWSSIYKLISPNISLVDRSQYIKMPFRFKVYEPFYLPTNLSNFNFSYEDCCNLRVKEILDHSNKLKKPITIFYSGGIDSTLVLISFFKQLSPEDIKNRIQIAMSLESIQENPNFYYDHIRGKCNIISSEYMGSLLNGDSIVVTGEFNDQLFGSDIIAEINRYGDYENLYNPYTRQFVISWFSRFMDLNSANIWFDILDDQIKKVAPCEVSTNFHFLWWYNFCLKWQCVFFRMLVRMDSDLRHLVNDHFVKNHIYHFFPGENFQKWSMLNHDKKIISDWKSYKLESRKIIYNYTKDESYRNEKIKQGSLYRLFLQKKVVEAITDEYDFLETLNQEEYYLSDNSFANY